MPEEIIRLSTLPRRNDDSRITSATGPSHGRRPAPALSVRLRDLLLIAAAFGFVLYFTFAAHAGVMLLNVSYDPTRELFKEINRAFATDWAARTGEAVSVKSSHSGSGAQARAVIDGLSADVVTLALAGDIDAISARSAKLAPDWQSRLPNHATPFNSTIVFLVRKGNPKGIHDWDDLTRTGVAVITPNPKTSGGARWNYLAAWSYAAAKYGGDETAIREFVARIYRNAPVLDTGARAATTSFAQRGIGDVLIAWENEAHLVLDHMGADRFEIVVPSISMLAEPPVSIIDAVVDAKGTRRQAEAYVQFLYSDEAQRIAVRHHYRPTRPEVVDPVLLATLPQLKLVSIDAFGGWSKAQPTHFGQGGIFDQIYKPGT